VKKINELVTSNKLTKNVLGQLCSAGRQLDHAGLYLCLQVVDILSVDARDISYVPVWIVSLNRTRDEMFLKRVLCYYACPIDFGVHFFFR
jgi:hypothetical protein